MRNSTYPSDISREQFDKILPLLESFRKVTKPRTVDLYDIFCGIPSKKWLPMAYASQRIPTLANGL